MTQLKFKLTGIGLLCAGMLVLASCKSEKKPEPAAAAKPVVTAAPANSSNDGATSVAIVPGEAGGIIEDRFTATATVTAIDMATRRISLTASDGRKASFTAPPEVQNFAQIRTGDKVTATFVERLVIFVRRDGQDPSAAHAAALAAAPAGAKPGALVAESYEITASLKSIDSATRTATLQFVDGEARSVKVRSDVDLSRYRTGDTVVIRVTTALALLVGAP